MLEPRIVTKRLILRSFRPEDASRGQLLYGDWEVLRMLLDEPYPYPEGAFARWIAQHQEMRANRTHYPLAIEHDSLCIGYVGVRPKQDQSCVIGYWLGVPYWRRGFMSEAVSAVAEFVFDSFPFNRLVARHRADNYGSERILANLGFKEVRRETVFSPSCKVECIAILRELTRETRTTGRS